MVIVFKIFKYIYTYISNSGIYIYVYIYIDKWVCLNMRYTGIAPINSNAHSHHSHHSAMEFGCSTASINPGNPVNEHG